MNPDQFDDGKVVVRWAKGKRLTDRLPNLSPITLSSPGTDRIYGSTRSTNSRFQFLKIQKYFSDSGHEEIRFSSKSVFVVDVRFELTTNDSCTADDAIC